MLENHIHELRKHIRALEKKRNSTVLVLAASHLEIEILPSLFEHLCSFDGKTKIDVVVHGRGGEVNAARRIALLLREKAKYLTFIVPFRCESSTTILTLCGDEIIAGELALFSPIDPQLQGAEGGAFSALDIQHFGEMAQRWFGIDASEARQQSLPLLCNNIFPPSLTAFYRSSLELQQTAGELLAFQLPNASTEKRQEIVSHLASGFYSHDYALNREDMTRLGLKVVSNPVIEAISWEISKLIQSLVGGNLRENEAADWVDVLIGSRNFVSFRRRSPERICPEWVHQRSE